ncbi:chloride channel protein [Vulgatibacter sp.]|uniref:chloride channel protein n=1 Tax=Vulgatibacter sp. TaxID=1971226 RepID=UPI003567E190
MGAEPRPSAGNAGNPNVFYSSLRAFLRDLPGVQQRFWVLVVLTGVAAGLGAVLLDLLLEAVEALAWPDGATFLERIEAAGWGQRVGVLVGAGLLVTIVALLLRQPLGGHGTSGIIQAIWVEDGTYSLRRALLRGLVIIGVVGMGAPLGREGALISSGAGSGSWLGRRFGLEPNQVRILVGCGAGAGIAAAYNVPIGGALFGLEVILGSFALELFGPIVVSCVTATIVSRVLLASEPAYAIPYYRIGEPLEIASFVLIAPLLGVAAAIYIRGIEAFANLPARFPERLRPLLPPLALGLTGVGAIWLPELLGNGYDPVNLALLGQMPLWLMLLLPFAKLLASALCAGAGVPGGLFTPSLFFGALLGGALGTAVQAVWPGAAPPGAYALIGMAAVLAGTTHAAISAVLITFEMTRDYGVILPVLLACAIATAVSRFLEPHSLYTGVLHRRGVPLPEQARPRWLRQQPVAPLVEAQAPQVGPSARFVEVMQQLLALPAGWDLYVVDAEGRFLGAIVLEQLKGHLPDSANLDVVIAADLADPAVPRLTGEETVAAAAARFVPTHLNRLPVVDPGSGRLLGTVARGDVLRQGVF